MTIYWTFYIFENFFRKLESKIPHLQFQRKLAYNLMVAWTKSITNKVKFRPFQWSDYYIRIFYVQTIPMVSSFILIRLDGWVADWLMLGDWLMLVCDLVLGVGSRLIGPVDPDPLTSRGLPVPFKHWWNDLLLLKIWDGGCVFDGVSLCVMFRPAIRGFELRCIHQVSYSHDPTCSAAMLFFVYKFLSLP